MASDYGLSRHRFARSFVAEAGLSPKLYARIVRFQRLVHVLLSTDVARWATTAMDLGYYDQAHMINEFRSFTGSSPTSFFQPHGEDAVHATVQIRGRPSEWVQRAQ
jgi:AraC-like DNA-binding protein